MKKITSILIFLFFCSNLFSQNYIDYTKLKSILYKKGGNITVEFIKSQTIKGNKENEVNELINLHSEFYNNLSTYKGTDIYRKCKSSRENADYWNNQVKRVKEGLLDDKKEVNRATNDFSRNSYITRYNNGVKRHKEYIKKRDNYVSDYNYCHKSEVEKSKRQYKRLTVLQKEVAAFYIEKWNNKTIITKSPTKKYNIESDDIMLWNSGTIEDLLRKAKDNETMAFAFICNADVEICQETYNSTFKASRSEVDAWSKSFAYKTGKLHNEKFISGKFNSIEVSEFMKVNNITHYPAFIWFNSEGKIIKKVTGRDTDVYNISNNLINNQTEEIDNFKENIKKKGCDDLLCYYNELHRVFLKTPDSRKDGKLYELIKNHPGKLNSPELQWLLNYSEFKELDSKDKMKIFNRALEFSYIKETGDYELSDAYNSYANDEKLKPLGKHAKAFKEYLIKEGEGKGFSVDKTSDRYPVYKKYDNGKLKYKGFRSKRLKYRIGKWIIYYESGAIKEEYELDEDSRIIGKEYIYYEDGKIYEICEDLKGTKNEKCIQYHKNGKISAEGNRNYWDEYLNGKWSHYYESGELLSTGSYEASLKVGLWKEYHKNGTVKATGNYTTYVGGAKKDKWEYYNENGIKIYTSNYSGSKDFTMTFYNRNGKINAVHIYKNDIRWRIMEQYTKDGKQTLKNGTGVYKVYNEETNQLEHTAEMKNGIRNGIANWYYKNGQLNKSALYKYSDKGDYTGLRWEILSMFDKEGNSLDKGTLKNGNGTWKTYDENGKFESIKSFTNGKEDLKK